MEVAETLQRCILVTFKCFGFKFLKDCLLSHEPVHMLGSLSDTVSAWDVWKNEGPSWGESFHNSVALPLKCSPQKGSPVIYSGMENTFKPPQICYIFDKLVLCICDCDWCILFTVSTKFNIHPVQLIPRLACATVSLYWNQCSVEAISLNIKKWTLGDWQSFEKRRRKTNHLTFPEMKHSHLKHMKQVCHVHPRILL